MSLGIVLGLALLLTLVGSLTSYAQDAEELIQAANDGFVSSVKALLDQGLNVNVKNNIGATALIAACGQGQTEVVKLLLARGADVNDKNN